MIYIENDHKIERTEDHATRIITCTHFNISTSQNFRILKFLKKVGNHFVQLFQGHSVVHEFLSQTTFFETKCRKKNVFSLCFLVFITISNLRFGEIVHYIYIASQLFKTMREKMNFSNKFRGRAQAWHCTAMLGRTKLWGQSSHEVALKQKRFKKIVWI